jgi:tRNA(Ile)-lysidine synthase
MDVESTREQGVKPPRELSVRFSRHLRERNRLADGDRVVVAVSGGLDSSSLLHLLRFTPELPDIELVVAHFDHRMRPGSERDCEWVRGLARGWGLRFVDGTSERTLQNESEAREERYAFLESLRGEVDARWIVTAHHADDQAETVLHRMVRGTGPGGLSGILEVREPGILRPLLPFHREELESYAARHRLKHRFDPSNLDRSFARNVLRLDVLPGIEAGVAVGARRSLARLARIAAAEDSAFESLLKEVEEAVVSHREPGRVSVDRARLLSYHVGVRARLIRRLAAGCGVRLDEAATSALCDFSAAASSGTTWRAPGRLEVAREFDQLVFSFGPRATVSSVLEIGDVEAGSGEVVIAGRRLSVWWSMTEVDGGSWTERFAVAGFGFPVRFRPWIPGDRIQLSYGSKKLNKLFAEARVPVRMRQRTPVFVDADERVLWVPGLRRSSWASPREGEGVLTVAVQEGA